VARVTRTRVATAATSRAAVGGELRATTAPSPSSLVDPHGGRAPLHPIVTTSPYDTQ
jgi:hypothetical protein